MTLAITAAVLVFGSVCFCFGFCFGGWWGARPLVEFAESLSARITSNVATHRCKVCGALWRLNPGQPSKYPPTHPFHDGTWTLVSATCGKCCDNVPMGEQIERLALDLRGGELELATGEG